MFLIEGCRELGRAIRCDISIDTVFFCRDFIKSGEQEDVLSASEDAGISICEVSRDIFEKISNRDNCDGLIGLANFWDTSVELAKGKNLSFVLVAEGIEKPGNLGALIRSAESAGVDFLILCDPVTDIFNPNVVRASQGAVFSTNIIVTDNKSAHDLLKKNNVNLFATTPDVDDIYFNENFTPNCAILVGAENSYYSSSVLKIDKYRKTEDEGLWPDDFAEVIIEGGNHAQFGSYGTQKGDGDPGITAVKQQKETAEAVSGWIRER